jgi:hypothetical protein
VYVSGWIPKFGAGPLGLGGANAPAVSESPSEKPTPASEEKKAEPQAEVPDESAPTAAPPGTGGQTPHSKVLHVLIDGRQYLVERPADGGLEYQPVPLDEVIKLAQAASGDEDGIRVRINRRGTARATAEIALREKLLAAGLSPESIREQVGLMP